MKTGRADIWISVLFYKKKLIISRVGERVIQMVHRFPGMVSDPDLELQGCALAAVESLSLGYSKEQVEMSCQDVKTKPPVGYYT